MKQYLESITNRTLVQQPALEFITNRSDARVDYTPIEFAHDDDEEGVEPQPGLTEQDKHVRREFIEIFFLDGYKSLDIWT